MHNLRLPAALAGLVATCGLIATPHAHAATSSASTQATGAACQLSIPTTDTKFRPKATGARNESTTTSNFVICPIPAPLATTDSAFTLVAAYVYSLDGASRDVTCTGVTGYSGSSKLKYSPKTYAVSSASGPIGAPFIWDASDFGGVANDPIDGGAFFSVTCLLPPQTAINFVYGAYKYNIGA